MYAVRDLSGYRYCYAFALWLENREKVEVICDHMHSAHVTRALSLLGFRVAFWRARFATEQKSAKFLVLQRGMGKSSPTRGRNSQFADFSNSTQ